MKNVNPLTLMRAQCGLTQEALGDAIGVTRQTIAVWEDGKRQPSVAQLSAIAHALGVPMSLLLPDSSSVPASEPTLLFRADDPAGLTPALRAILSKKAADYAMVERIVHTRGLLPESRPMDSDDENFVEQTASSIRSWLGRGDLSPLGDVLSLLEERGLKVICHSLPDKLAGFSAYTEKWGAVIVINHAEPTERRFFTALHELGHLIFHRQDYVQPQVTKGRLDPREKSANRFAGAVLLPAEAVKAELHPYRNRAWIPEPLLLDIKRRYWVSMRTVLMRAAQAGCISKEQAGRQIGSLNAKYGREKEDYPLDEPKRLTRLERLVYQALLEDELTALRAAEILSVPLAEVRQKLSSWKAEAEEELDSL